MNDDELQVLGKRRKLSKREKWKLAILTIGFFSITALFGLGCYLYISPRQADGREAWKEEGESTIVPELQSAVDSLLNAELTEIDGLQGQAIVMEVQTGEILAMVGLERNFEGKLQPCKNFAYQQELGSTAQTAALLAALETGKVELSDTVDTGNGIWPVDNERYMRDHNWERGGYGMITFDRALEVSSNIGISKAVRRAFGNDAQGFLNQLEKMSYGQPDSIEGIDGLRPTVYSSPKDRDWANWLVCWHAIGYERLMAPIQMLTFYNAIANDGKMVKPTLITKAETEVINPHIASGKNIKLIQETLDHVVSQGLGAKAGITLLSVAGKTATSQIKKYYDFGDAAVCEYQVGFCGYFPADAPKFSIIVSMNKLGLPASGGGMAGVVFHYIMKWMIAHGMPNTLMVDEETNDTIRISPENVDSITKAYSEGL